MLRISRIELLGSPIPATWPEWVHPLREHPRNPLQPTGTASTQVQHNNAAFCRYLFNGWSLSQALPVRNLSNPLDLADLACEDEGVKAGRKSRS